jgi:hypothetical protein
MAREVVQGLSNVGVNAERLLTHARFKSGSASA